MKKFFALFLAAVFCCGMLSSCGSKEPVSKIDKIKKAGKLVAYTNPEFPPYEYVGEGGVITGSEMELVRAIAKKLGVEAEIVSAEFDSIIGTIVTGKADIGASGFTITEERMRAGDFSIPFISSVQYLIVPEKSGIKTVEDLAGKLIGGQQGTTGMMMIEDCVASGLLKDTGAVAKQFNNAPDATVAMKSGQIDAVVIDDLVAKSLANKNPGYVAIPLVKADGEGLDAPEEFGIAVAKGNDDLLALINEVIAEARLNGWIEIWQLEHYNKTAQ